MHVTVTIVCYQLIVSVTPQNFDLLRYFLTLRPNNNFCSLLYHFSFLIRVQLCFRLAHIFFWLVHSIFSGVLDFKLI